MKLFKDHLQTVIALAAVISLALGAVNYFTPQSEFEVLAAKVDADFIERQIASKQKRIYTIKDRYGEDLSSWPITVREEYRQLQDDIKKLNKRLDAIYKKGG